MEFHAFKIDAQKLTPLLQRDLYKDPNVMLRETLQNALDAIVARATVDLTFKPETDGKIIFEHDKDAGTLKVTDNGAGMSREALLDVFRYYGRSEKGEGQAGMFGVGAKSIFAVADSFTINTKSIATGETNLVYVTLEGLNFVDKPPEREGYGTTITIPKKSAPSTCGLSQYSRCVRVPVFLRARNKELMLSRSEPFRTAIKLSAEDFDVYLNSSPLDSCSGIGLYVNGIFVCEYDNDRISDTAVNILRKESVDLTMGRDSPIRNSKLRRLVRKVKDEIAEYAKANLTSDPEKLWGDGWKLIMWLKSSTHHFLELSDEQIQAVDDLAAEVNYISGSSASKSAPLIALLRGQTAKTNYYSFRPVEEITSHMPSKPCNVIVGMRYRALSKQRLEEVLKKFGVREVEVLRQPGPHQTRVFLQDGNRKMVVIPSMERPHDGQSIYYGNPLLVFDRETDMDTVQKIVVAFSCTGIRLPPEIRAPENRHGTIDLRNDPSPPGGLRAGKPCGKSDFEQVERLVVVPPTLNKVAAFGPPEVIFPSDLRAAAKLVMKGAMAAGETEIASLIRRAVPDQNLAKAIVPNMFKYLHQRDEAIRLLTELVTGIDWADTYARALYRMAFSGSTISQMDNMRTAVRELRKVKKEKEGAE